VNKSYIGALEYSSSCWQFVYCNHIWWGCCWLIRWGCCFLIVFWFFIILLFRLSCVSYLVYIVLRRCYSSFNIYFLVRCVEMVLCVMMGDGLLTWRDIWWCLLVWILLWGNHWYGGLLIPLASSVDMSYHCLLIIGRSTCFVSQHWW
jgi:hypothetical protein